MFINLRPVALALGIGVMMASCRGESPAPAPTQTPVATPAATSSITPANGARSVLEETDDFRFEYSYPADAGNIAELAALLDGMLERRRANLAERSAQAREDARDNGFPFNKYSNTFKWEVVADTPRYLSLSADFTTYEGGAHGNYGFDTMVWDREEQKALDPATLFTSMEELDAALAEEFCQALNKEREMRRGAPVAEDSEEMFDQCVSLDETTVLLGSSNGRAFDRIGVQVGPYVAGPYAEGAYEFTFNVDAEVLAAVAEPYATVFSARNQAD